MYEELVKRLRTHNGWALNETLDEAADVVERKTGEWVKAVFNSESDNEYKFWANYCSACKAYLPYGLDWTPNFCPNCGADMREECK